MKKLKISSYSLIVVSIIKIGMLYPLRELAKTVNEMETRYTNMRNKVSGISTFEDSLIYNADFRSRILGSTFTRVEFDSAITKIRIEGNEAIEETEVLLKDRKRLVRNFNIYEGIDQLLNLLTALAGGLMIYYWIKVKK